MLVAVPCSIAVQSAASEGVLIKGELARAHMKARDVLELARYGAKSEPIELHPNVVSTKLGAFGMIEIGFKLAEDQRS